MQFRCIADQIEWQSLLREMKKLVQIHKGGCSRYRRYCTILCKALGFDWFKDEQFFISKHHCESSFEYFLIASYV